MVYSAAQKRYSLKQLFMNRNSNNTDGFVLRRRNQNSDISSQHSNNPGPRAVPERFLVDGSRSTVHAPQRSNSSAPTLHRPTGPAAVASGQSFTLPKPQRETIGINLDLDDDKPQKTLLGGKVGKKDKKNKGRRGNRKKWSRKKKIIVAVVGVLVAIILAVAGYFIYKLLNTGDKIFKGNVISALFDQAQPLKEDANGRSNILLFGTSEDDPDHPGADLTDSIMVLSVNQKKNDAFIVSIPRDFHVKYGMACVPGYEGKINVLYSCNKDQGEEAAAGALKAKVGEILGLDIQYYAHVNYTVLREAVDAVGGITVEITSDDPRGILDRNFDWKCNYKCYYVKYPIGPASLDGEHALALARARGDVAPTYGLSRSNPDRQDNQRKILIALKDKAVSAGVLSNPVAVNGLMDTLGNNLRTNFAANEVKTLVELGKNVKNENITSFSLEDATTPLATATCFSGDICPNAGNFNYMAIQAAVNRLATMDDATREGPTVDVYNASGTTGLAQTKADELAAKNFTIKTVDTAPASLGSQPISFYDLTGGKKPASAQKLKDLLKVDVTAGAPAGITPSADFVVIVGKQASN